MDLDRLGSNWDAWGRQDAMYAVLTDPAKRHNGWDADAFFATGREEIAGVFDYLHGLGIVPARQAALDFGCGVGRLSQALADHFDSVVGLDIAPSMIRQANEHNRFGDRVRYLVNARDDLSVVASQSIDFVYCNIVLQHMRPDYALAYVRDFFRVLRPGGVAVFFLPEAVAAAPVAVSVKARVKELVRRTVNAVSYGVRGSTVLPGIDMFGTARSTVESAVRSAGGVVRDVVADPSAGDGWTGYRYCCQPSASAGDAA